MRTGVRRKSARVHRAEHAEALVPDAVPDHARDRPRPRVLPHAQPRRHHASDRHRGPEGKLLASGAAPRSLRLHAAARRHLLRNRLRRLRSSTAAARTLTVRSWWNVGGNCKFPIRGNRKPHTLLVGGGRPAFHAVVETNSEEAGPDARMGDEDAAEALSGTGRLEGGVGEALRGESPDAPRVDRVEPVGPGPVVRGRTVFAAAARTAQAGPLRRDHRFPSRGVPRAVSEAAVRRGPRGWLRR